jgi:fibronectin-binding autotransporter adhesin
MSAIQDLSMPANDALANFTNNVNSASFTLLNGRNLMASVFSNAGSMTVGAGSTFMVTGNFTQTGTITVAGGGLVSVTGALVQSGGTLTLAAMSTLTVSGGYSLLGGMLSGMGTINGDVTNSSLITVGDAVSVTGVLTINGNYTQTATGTLSIKIGGPAAGSQYDQLVVNNGSVTLAGTLNVTLIGGYVPDSGTMFQVLMRTGSGSLMGTFAHPLGGDGPLFTDTYSPDGVKLTA